MSLDLFLMFRKTKVNMIVSEFCKVFKKNYRYALLAYSLCIYVHVQLWLQVINTDWPYEYSISLHCYVYTNVCIYKGHSINKGNSFEKREIIFLEFFFHKCKQSS